MKTTTVMWGAALAAALFLALPATVRAEDGSSIGRFATWESLLDGSDPLPLRPLDGLKPCLQDGWGWGTEDDEEEKPKEEQPDSGWGWGDEDEEKPKPKPQPGGGGSDWGWGDEGESEPATPAPAPQPGDDSGWGSGWGEGEGQEGLGEGEPAPFPGEEEVDTAPSGPVREWVRDVRIGIEFGAFLPFGAEKEAFETGELGGVLFGFGLPSILEGVVITNELRVLGGYTLSKEQETGFDVKTTLFLFKDDLLFHFLPRGRGFGLYAFVGIALALENSSAEKDLLTSTDERSESFTQFLVDGGLGAWITLSGPVDLLLRLEFDLVPMADNVPFFAVGQVGLQVRF